MDFSKRFVSLDKVVEALNQADTEVGNKADVGASDKADTGDSNKVGVTIEPDFKDGINDGVKSKANTEVFYRLDLLIPKDNHTKNFLFCNLANVLANLFSNLLPISMNFRSSSAFLVFSSHSAASNNTSSPNLLILHLLMALALAILVIFLLFINNYLLI